MKIFITGGSGLLGQYLNLELNRKHDILTQYQTNIGNCKDFNSVQVSITDQTKLTEIFNSFKPDVVVHTAAVSNPEKADKLSADVVYNINVNATKNLAELCAKNNSKLIYLSTDLVYAGYRGSMLKEDAKLIPLSLYAETKLMGEIKIQETFNNYLILREALLIGFGLNHTRNNFHLMFDNLRNGREVILFTDQFRTPLSLIDSARMIGELIEKNISGEVLNLGGSERLSRYELGEMVCELGGFNKNLLVKRTMEETDLVYKVADVSLSTEKLNSYGVYLKNIKDSIQEILSKRI
ncbi:MAG: NAD(P)-dependent oxidoreductase [Ignavibacteria bacterium RIFOXYA2_FULL_37_17]|nr:MAG: NAD(P)-dependent oxidoreductase [Ignavibacteria bacterium RIFOXYA2_FULL_37_17]